MVAKVFISGILFTAALSAFRACPVDTFVPRAVASVTYLLNPFVYDRLAYGQLTVLAGYAVLPLVLIATKRVIPRGTMNDVIVLSTVLTIATVLDIHEGGIALCLVLGLAAAYLLAVRARSEWPPVVKRFGAVILVTCALNVYWLAPLIANQGPQASTLAAISASDVHAFATSSDPRLGLVPNVLGLYGFWAEGTGRFESMKAFTPLWQFVGLALGLVAMVAVIRPWPPSEPRRPFDRLWLTALLVVGAVSFVLDAGVASPVTAPVTVLIDRVFPPYLGMRDSNKWASLLALVYMQIISVGASAVQRWSRGAIQVSMRRNLAAAGAAGVLLALPIYYGNGLLYGMHGQIRPTTYPPGWYSADVFLQQDPHVGTALFLPWHGYMSYSFIQNRNRITASPAPYFFSVPVLASSDLEVPGLQSPRAPGERAIDQLVASGPNGEWAYALAKQSIEYVLLAREFDWSSYSYLDTQPNLVVVADFTSVVVYKNLLYRSA